MNSAAVSSNWTSPQRITRQPPHCNDSAPAASPLGRVAFRADGTAAAREIWGTPDTGIRRGCAAQLLVQYGWSVDGDAGAPTPKATVRLLRATVPVTWLAHQS
ncbi:hypothetical protein ACFVT9_29080 [Kitasatospora cineracea]|uniref:hypothetical protein n=1 Tax=Kitasatospora cineracea TaxID=88074 RepID=UPI0036DE6411